MMTKCLCLVQFAKMKLFLLILPFFLLNYVNSTIHYYQPEQVHIAYGENIYEIVITWSTMNDTKESLVEYGIGGLILQEKGSSEIFIDGGKAKHFQFVHKVRLSNLQPNSKYGEYICLRRYVF